MAFSKTLWKKYTKALARASKTDTNQMEKHLLKYPQWYALGALVFVVLFATAIWNAATYVAPPPLPTMNIYGFIDAVLTMQVAWPIWAILFLFLWLTKW